MIRVRIYHKLAMLLEFVNLGCLSLSSQYETDSTVVYFMLARNLPTLKKVT